MTSAESRPQLDLAALGSATGPGDAPYSARVWQDGSWTLSRHGVPFIVHSEPSAVLPVGVNQWFAAADARLHPITGTDRLGPFEGMRITLGTTAAGQSLTLEWLMQLYAEGATSPRMMSVGLHCRLVGRPGRAASLARFLDYAQGHDDVWICRRIDIARHWIEHHPHPGGQGGT